jgi:hypothetical protein
MLPPLSSSDVWVPWTTLHRGVLHGGTRGEGGQGENCKGTISREDVSKAEVRLRISCRMAPVNQGRHDQFFESFSSNHSAKL